MFGMMAPYGFLGMLAMILFLTFAASGITWLIATVVPGTIEAGRRSVGMVAGISGALLLAVLVIGSVLVPPGVGPGPRGLRPVPGVSGQPGQQPAPTR